VGKYGETGCEGRSTTLVVLMHVCGSMEFAAAYARGLAEEALDAFETAFANALAGPHTDFVRAVVPYMVARRA
jgi:hypothetical protein